MSKILLVNDEADINLSVRKILEDQGYEVDSYEDPIVTLENFKPKYYCLVIIDNKMPKMDGFTFYRKIKALDSTVKMCFLTAAEISQKCPENIASLLPASHIIRIPIDNEELLHRIKVILSDLG
jgi:DNA-binding response OmpR family regulator